MAPSKRKRTTAQNLTSAQPTPKRAKTTTLDSSQHPHGEIDFDRDYRVRSIIDETKGYYRIDWEDDAVTGESFAPTWEPKANANEAAIRDWEAKRKALAATKVNKRKRLTSSPAPQVPSTPTVATPDSSKRPKRRVKRVIESSPTSSGQVLPVIGDDRVAPPEVFEADVSRADGSQVIEIDESQFSIPQASTEIAPGSQQDSQAAGDSQPIPGVSVVISDPPSSYIAGAYEVVSQADAEEDSFILDTTQLSVDQVSAQGVPASSGAQTADQRISPAPVNNTAVSEEQGQITKSTPSTENTQGLAPALSSLRPSEEYQDQSTSPSIPESAQQSLVRETVTPIFQTAPERPAEQALGEQSALLIEPLSRIEDQQVEKFPESTETFRESHSERADSPAAASNETQLLQDIARSKSTEVPAVEVISSSLPITHSVPSNLTQSSASRVSPVRASSLPQPFTTLPPAPQLQSHTRDFFGVVLEPNTPLGSPERLGAPISSLPVARDVTSHPAFQDPPRQPAEPQTYTPPPVLFSQSQGGESSTAFLTQVAYADKLELSPHTPIASPSSSTHRAYPGHLESPYGAALLEQNDYSVPLPSREFPPETTPAQRDWDPSHQQRRSRVYASSSPAPRPTMDPSTPGSSGKLGERLREMRAKHKSTASRTSPPHLDPSLMDKPASAIPPGRSIEIAATIGRALSPLISDGMRSPSAVPAQLPDDVVTREDMNTSERYPTLVPTMDSSGSSGLRTQIGSSNGHRPSGASNEPLDSELENAHTVPIILLGHQRDLYAQEILFHNTGIEAYLATNSPSAELQAQAEELVLRLRSMLVHPDLINSETATQHADRPEMQARWDVDCSAKFRFLKSLLPALHEHNVSVAVAVRGPRVYEILEVFLRGIHVPFTRLHEPRESESSVSQISACVAIVDLDVHQIDVVQRNFTAVVVLDGVTSHKDEAIRSLRRRADGTWAHLLWLVAPRSIEHLYRCLLQTLSPQARLKALVSGTVKLKKEAGRPEEGQVHPGEAAEAVASFLQDPKEWPLSELSMLEDLDSQTESDSAHSPEEESAQQAAMASKRPLADEPDKMDMDSAPKRVRAEDDHPPATVNPQDIEVTHISDSVGRPTQIYESEVQSTSAVTSIGQHTKRLEELIFDRESRLEDLNRALEDLQYRHEEQRKALVVCTKERDSAVATVQAALDRRTRAEVDNAALRTERSELKAQIVEAGVRLQSHEVPERREIEVIRSMLDNMRVEVEKAEKRAEASDREAVYTREIYQDASSKAQELGKQNALLQARVIELEKAASVERGRARDTSRDLYNDNLVKENRKLKQILGDREAALKFKDEEIARLKEAGRGRIGTRGSSVPRSPRRGSPLKTGRGSRQTSPAAQSGNERGHRSHPLRNSNASG